MSVSGFSDPGSRRFRPERGWRSVTFRWSLLRNLVLLVVGPDVSPRGFAFVSTPDGRLVGLPCAEEFAAAGYAEESLLRRVGEIPASALRAVKQRVVAELGRAARALEILNSLWETRPGDRSLELPRTRCSERGGAPPRPGRESAHPLANP